MYIPYMHAFSSTNVIALYVYIKMPNLELANMIRILNRKQKNKNIKFV